MTEYEALKLGKELNENITNNANNIIPTKNYIAFVGMAISALEKQIPKKPVNQKYSFFSHSNLLKSKYGECPICNTVQADDEFCQHCGQKLDWSDEQ